MKRCAQCGGKLGLGVKYQNLWRGYRLVHLRFCSKVCEQAYEVMQRRASKQSRRLAAPGNDNGLTVRGWR
jgi:hypothetical protein